MRSREWFWYLIGQRSAIRELAKWRGGIWAGAVLVLLTAVARNYDQNFITEKPLMWLFGPLLFSIVSGSWLYIVLYGWFARREMADDDGRKPAFWSGWRSFMGLFWLTAPVAWLYAIPVERFVDSLSATKLNLILLAAVSLWRVMLMARVTQVVTSASYVMALVWVVFAAAIEVCVVFFFGGGFARAIMASMGGMRNSPEEEILLSAMNNIFGVAFWAVPIALVVALVWCARRRLTAMPEAQVGPMPWRTLAALAVFWIVIAVLPQRELANSVAVERLMAQGRPRELLDYMAKHSPTDFAPARALPPRPYEWDFFVELPACFGSVQATDPAWVRSHLMRRLDDMLLHYGPRWGRHRTLASYSQEEQTEHVFDGLKSFGPDAAGLLQLLDGLERIPEGPEWLRTNTAFLAGIRAATEEMPAPRRQSTASEVQRRNDWLTLSNRLERLRPDHGP